MLTTTFVCPTRVASIVTSSQRGSAIWRRSDTDISLLSIISFDWQSQRLLIHSLYVNSELRLKPALSAAIQPGAFHGDEDFNQDVFSEHKCILETKHENRSNETPRTLTGKGYLKGPAGFLVNSSLTLPPAPLRVGGVVRCTNMSTQETRHTSKWFGFDM